ncbi:MAG: CHAT domain-containing protein [Oscillatoria sp. SIO1A7]|nr:CHAT domain-containing protein [Oscillatoria sp. SIO1A7]
MRQSLRRTSFERERLPLAQKIYDWLIRPAEEELATSGIETLVFVLDGELRNLPMAALHDGKQYLIEKYGVAMTPGLQLLPSQKLSPEELNILTGALGQARQGFPALPGAMEEIGKIQQEFPVEVLLDAEFTNQSLQEQIAAVPFPVIHLATHGQFSSNAEDTFILTWDNKINVTNLRELLGTRSQQELQAIELFVLSACETAAGDDRAALGLAGVALRSGARSTLATLWQVNDASTALFMARFYRELASQPALGKAEALRRAQLALLEQSRYQHPYFWAPFVLVGNWQ